jgi:hypothetical protein
MIVFLSQILVPTAVGLGHSSIADGCHKYGKWRQPLPFTKPNASPDISTVRGDCHHHGNGLGNRQTGIGTLPGKNKSVSYG